LAANGKSRGDDEVINGLMPAVSRGHAGSCEACGARTQSICAALSAGDLPAMAAIRSDVRFAPGQSVFFEGDPADSLFNVKLGVVKLFKLLVDGRTQITGFLFPGDFLGLALLNKYSYSAEAVTAAELCKFPRVEFESLLVRFPALEKKVLGNASHELAAAQEQMLLLGRKTAQERLATFLLMMQKRAASPTDADIVILPMSRQDIGDFLGLTIETVSRTVTRLKKSGVIELPDPNRVIIRDAEALTELSGLEDL
jgi:CRP/FNR family transcriptional regulator, anaerobic regulatory protein